MPHPGVVHALDRVALAQFAQVQPRAEMAAVSRNHGRFDFGAKALESLAQAHHQPIVDGVALGRSGESHDGHGAPQFQREIGRKGGD